MPTTPAVSCAQHICWTRTHAKRHRKNLRALEDRAIIDVLSMQEEAGMPVVTDGEFRRELFFSTVVAVTNGYDPYGCERFHRDEEGHELHFGTFRTSAWEGAGGEVLCQNERMHTP